MTDDMRGLWIVVFRMSTYDLLALSPDGDSNLSVFFTREDAEDAVDGHPLEDMALFVDVYHPSPHPHPREVTDE